MASEADYLEPKIRPEEADRLGLLLTLLTLGVVRFFVVPQGWVCLVTEVGKYLRTAQPGLHRCWSLWNLYQRPEKWVPVKEQVLSFYSKDVVTKDGVACTIKPVVFYSVRQPAKAAFAVEDYLQAIKELVSSLVRDECGNLSAAELLASRRKLASGLREALDRDTEPWGIAVRLVEIKELQPHLRKEAKL